MSLGEGLGPGCWVGGSVLFLNESYIIVREMGNATARQTALTRNWRHVSPSLIRNQTTRELIQEDTLSFANPDTQHLYSQLLTRRIRLQHPHILKLIYFSPSNSVCTCSMEQKPYRTLAYTEYAGECLPDYLSIHPLPLDGNCPCVGIIEGVTYLQNYYGYFEVSEQKVFLGQGELGSAPSVKVWVNACRAECQPERSCSEREMIISLAKVYSFITNNGLCRCIRRDQHQVLKSIKSLADFKTEILRIHQKGHFGERDRKKCSSLYQLKPKDRRQTIVADFQEEQSVSIPPRQMKESLRYQSTPHTNHNHSNKPVYVHFIQPERPNTQRPLLRDPRQNVAKPVQSGTLSTQNTFNLAANPSSYTVYSHDNEVLRPLSQLSQKVHFKYANADRSFDRKADIRSGEQKVQQKFVSQEEMKQESIAIGREPQPKALRPVQNKANYHPTILFEPGYGTYAVSQNVTSQNSPFQPVQAREQKKEIGLPREVCKKIEVLEEQNRQFPSKSEFTVRQMELPLREHENKQPSAHLPTTSRSPKRPKEESRHPIQEVKLIAEAVEMQHTNQSRRPQRQESYRGSGGAGIKRFSKPSLGTKNSKLEQYTKEIKETEESIRQWISQSTGEKTGKRLQQVNTAPLKPGLRVQAPGYKDAKSIYNDSEYRQNEGSAQEYIIRGQNFEQVYQVDREGSKQQSNLSEKQRKAKQILAYEAEIKAEYLRQKELERQRLLKRESDLQEEKQFELEQRRAIAEREKKRLLAQSQKKSREDEERRQAQRDLEQERRHIQNEMDDLLRNSVMKEEYRSIRQKVKQKKETFAQLKAEAAKILDDCLY